MTIVADGHGSRAAFPNGTPPLQRRAPRSLPSVAFRGCARPAAPAACGSARPGAGAARADLPAPARCAALSGLALRGGAPPFATRLTSAPPLRARRGGAPLPACRRIPHLCGIDARKKGAAMMPPPSLTRTSLGDPRSTRCQARIVPTTRVNNRPWCVLPARLRRGCAGARRRGGGTRQRRARFWK